MNQTISLIKETQRSSLLPREYLRGQPSRAPGGGPPRRRIGGPLILDFLPDRAVSGPFPLFISRLVNGILSQQPAWVETVPGRVTGVSRG